MKVINLQHYETPDKTSLYIKKRNYSIALGNGLTRRFSNRNNLTAFITHINKELNIYLFEILSILTESYREIYKLFLHVDHFRALNNAIRSLHDVDRSLQFAIDRSSYPNGNHFTFHHLNNAIENIQFTIKKMITIRKKKNQYLEVRFLEIISNRLTELSTKLNNLGKEYPKKKSRILRD